MGEWELFDLEKDPHEMKSIYAEESSKQIVEKLKNGLEELRKQYKDDGSGF